MPFLRRFGVKKLRKTETFCSFIHLASNNLQLSLTVEIIGSLVSSADASKISGHKKEKYNHMRVIFHLFSGIPPLGYCI